MKRRYLASSERSDFRNDEVDNEFIFNNREFKVGDHFTSDGLDWVITKDLDEKAPELVVETEFGTIKADEQMLWVIHNALLAYADMKFSNGEFDEEIKLAKAARVIGTALKA